MPLLTIPAVLASAELGPDTQRWISSVVFYENANACMWAGISAQVCQSAHRSAYRQHVRIAPSYRSEPDCEADFVPAECFVSGVSRLWTPWLSGFALITHARLPTPSAPNRPQRPTQAVSGDRSWWQQLQGVKQAPAPATDVRYFSEPLYWERDQQGGLRLTTLREKLSNGDRFANAFSRRPPVKAGSTLWTRQLARIFEPQLLVDITTL